MLLMCWQKSLKEASGMSYLVKGFIGVAIMFKAYIPFIISAKVILGPACKIALQSCPLLLQSPPTRFSN
jgi:hypothetical protein